MVKTNGKYIMGSFLKKWKVKMVLSQFLRALSITILLLVFLMKIIFIAFIWAVSLFEVIFLLFVFSNPIWKVTEREISGFLNRNYPQLEESSQLILKPFDSLNFLQKLQVQKVEKALSEIERPNFFDRAFISSILFLCGGLLISFFIMRIPFSIKDHFSHGANSISSIGQPASFPEKIFPEMSFIQVKIAPPLYTKKAVRNQDKFNLVAEEGSTVIWQLKTTTTVKNLKLIFNDKQVLSLRSSPGQPKTFTGVRGIFKPGFYQVVMDNKTSEFYKIEVVKDLPPVIKIMSPKPNLVIDFGMPYKVRANVILSDDYGIKYASISATISSGSGEAVKFKEQQMLFENFNPGNTKYNLQKLLDLNALGMKPGDELYFYVRAEDNHNQEKRSDVYIISLADTAQLMSMDGLVNGVDLKPEYFRSERQIIIEAEQLIKNRDMINVQEFNNRSNNLGIDQKLLRLRYGKFLGEESETEIGPHDDERSHNDAADFGNAAKVIDEYLHKHDNAEDASFFEPTLKAQLKATLNEMWKAELQLRVNKPSDALPFAYKALRLLKDLQQKSRVYVAKTGFKSTPLKPEKRLTGDLSKISQPVVKEEVEKDKDAYEVSRKAAGILGLLRTRTTITSGATEILQQANLQIFNEAASQPSLFLPAVESMKKIVSATANHKPVKLSDIAVVENALQKMLSVPGKLPPKNSRFSYQELSDSYFKNLNKSNQQ